VGNIVWRDPCLLLNILQVQPEHPLLQLLASGSKQRQQARGQEAAPAGPAAEGANQPYFPLRLSPAGARSLLFANFWVALLEAPLR
jgi:hypothetical protein